MLLPQTEGENTAANDERQASGVVTVRGWDTLRHQYRIFIYTFAESFHCAVVVAAGIAEQLYVKVAIVSPRPLRCRLLSKTEVNGSCCCCLSCIECSLIFAWFS